MFGVHVLSNGKRISVEHLKWKRVRNVHCEWNRAVKVHVFIRFRKFELRKWFICCQVLDDCLSDDNCCIFGIALHGPNLRIIAIIII